MDQQERDAPCFGGEEARTRFEDAQIVVLPAPLEATVSFGKGTSEGPAAILRASAQVELYDEQLRLEPFRAGIWTDSPPQLAGVPVEAAVERIGRRVGERIDAGKWVATLGGEHTVTVGAVSAAAARYPGLHVFQLDAHADLRESYEGSRFSHACAMARCIEVAPVRAVGIRNYSVEEAARIRGGIPGYGIVHAWEMEGSEWAERALEGLDGKPVYLTVDVDYFDPSILPATGTPEPGGGQWWPTLRLLEALFRRARVVGCDVVELAPIPGLHHADFSAARLVYKLIGLAFRTTF